MVLSHFSFLLSSLCLPVLTMSKCAELITKPNGFFQSNLTWDPKAIQARVKESFNPTDLQRDQISQV